MSVNKVFIIGNITRDAEIREAGQNKLARFTVATSERYRTQSGEQREDTEFHEVNLWGSEKIHQYLTKGRQVCVEGSIKTEKWTNSDGEERRKTIIKAQRVDLLGGLKRESDDDGDLPL